jgi:hypothetical protein
MIIKTNHLNFWVTVFIVSLCFIIPISVLVSTRELGTDTVNYEYSFYLFKEYSYMTNEPGIYFLAWLSVILGGDVELYFWFVFFFTIVFINLAFYTFFNTMFNVIELCLFYLAFLGVYFLSTWFQVVTLSVIRHGLALFILYYAMSCFVRGEIFKFLIFFIISALFHMSTLLILPFLPLLKISEKKFYIIFFSTAILYTLGFTEYLVMAFSEITSIPLYQSISSYSEDNVRYFGFNYFYFIYTIIWTCIGLYFQKKIMDKHVLCSFNNLIRVYSCLSMVLFVFGFASFSNRYGLFSWLFIPFIQVAILGQVLRLKHSTYYLCVLIFLIGIAYYCNNFFNYQDML